MVEQPVVDIISRHTRSVSKDVFPRLLDCELRCSRPVVGTSKLVVSDPRNVVGPSRIVVGAPRIVVSASSLVLDAPRILVGASRIGVKSPRHAVGAPRLLAATHSCF
jgi:hypothetical protein